MRPHGTTHADEVARHDRLIALLARRPAIRRLQRALEDVGDLWRPPDHLHFCLGGSVHWRVPPSADAVAIVAAHHASDDPDVRRLVAGALRHAAPHGPAASGAVAACLADADPLVRMQAARAAAALDLGEALADALAAQLDDAVWTARWNAARALARTGLGERALPALLASQPAPAHRLFDEWVQCVEAFADRPAARERLAALFPP